MEILFHKMHGLGNDFMLLDCRESAFSLTETQMRTLGDRKTGVGFDQLLVIENSTAPGAHARYRIFNQDGSAAEHCGNGVRCVGKFLHERLADHPRKIVVEIAEQTFELAILDSGDVRVDMGPPILEPSAVPSGFHRRALRYTLELDGKRRELGVVSMGNPHAVFEVDDLESAPVETIGKALQQCATFPQQVNVGFMQNMSRNAIRLRVWERGVGETRACGTGACAAVVVGRLWGELDEAVTVSLTGGDLHIDWTGVDTDPVWMTGRASYVFEGRMTI